MSELTSRREEVKARRDAQLQSWYETKINLRNRSDERRRRLAREIALNSEAEQNLIR